MSKRKMSTEITKAEQKTVRFDVGGQLYRVSKSLIEQHEETMLARLVSDTWLADPNSTIFIDRDGERFKYVLDYLRYGKVSLPLTVPREMFLLDMEYYGFKSVDKDTARSVLDNSEIEDDDAKKKVASIFAKNYHQCLIEILLLEKASVYARLFFGEPRANSWMRVVHPASGATLSAEERSKSELFLNYLKAGKHELFNRCLARFGLQAADIFKDQYQDSFRMKILSV